MIAQCVRVGSWCLVDTFGVGDRGECRINTWILDILYNRTAEAKVVGHAYRTDSRPAARPGRPQPAKQVR